MIVGRVAGTVTTTINHPFYDGKKLLLVERLAPTGELTGDCLIAIDSVGAGFGERVLVLDEGTGARQVVGSATAPLRSVIVGIVDAVTVT
ncbi:MAG: EutN/CcmL family microcompartment protein [Thermoanaerobaculaceae bacterium]|jgi:microcompartment protein CcmK/EutM|nr:EutN/CcmL family microcompartment protein [Thermoanaerobaculaceae bacterium]